VARKMNVSRTKSILSVTLILVSVLLVSAPDVQATLYVNWTLDTTDKGEFITAFAHLYGVPLLEKNYNWYFCVVKLDASAASVSYHGIIELSVGTYAQPARESFSVTQHKVYYIGLNPTFNDKVAQVSTPTPVTVDLRITDNAGKQLYADSKSIQMLPLNYYAWALGKNDLRKMSVVLATPHADPIQKVIGVAAKATPWNQIPGYQQMGQYTHSYIVDSQMRAVYNVLQNLGITYVSTKTAFTSAFAQRVRLPVQTLSDKGGNCIETTLLFDAIFEAIGFRTRFVFVTGHVFLAVEEWPGSQTVLPLETTLIGVGSYDKAREIGLQTYKGAKGDQEYLEFDVREVRDRGLTPTPYMDKMPSETSFYSEIDQVSAKVASARTMILKVKDATKGTEKMPSDVEKLYNEAVSLFESGRYPEAEKAAAEALKAATGGGMGETLLGLTFLSMPVALIVLVVLYVRARRRKSVAAIPPPSTPATPATEYCMECGKEMSFGESFCRHCGARQTS